VPFGERSAAPHGRPARPASAPASHVPRRHTRLGSVDLDGGSRLPPGGGGRLREPCLRPGAPAHEPRTGREFTPYGCRSRLRVSAGLSPASLDRRRCTPFTLAGGLGAPRGTGARRPGAQAPVGRLPVELPPGERPFGIRGDAESRAHGLRRGRRTSRTRNRSTIAPSAPSAPPGPSAPPCPAPVPAAQTARPARIPVVRRQFTRRAPDTPRSPGAVSPPDRSPASAPRPPRRLPPAS
jgi:hypothetical protein